MLNNNLQIVLITYNRKESLKNTLDSILSENSPVKDFDITILDNHSTDGTSEMLQEYAIIHKNLTHVINKINIGGNANICKAFVDYLNKDYIWVLCDNDFYNWDSWDEVKSAIKNNYDVIMTRNCENNISELFHDANLVSGVIYKTKNITETVIENMYCNIKNLFPHLAIMAKNLNDNNKIYIVKKDIVILGVNPGYATTYTRGVDTNDIPISRAKIFWSVGFFNSLELIKDRNKQIQIIDNLKHHHKNLYELFKSAIIYNKIYRNNYFDNLHQIYKVLSFKQKIKFTKAYLSIQLSNKNYKYWFIRYPDEWKEFLQEINEQKYIDNLAKKFKNKKVMLYGAGMFAKILLQNYDLSKLNIIGISDKKFETLDETEFYGIETIKPSDLVNAEFDILLFTMKEYKKVAEILKHSGLNKPIYPIIKKDNKYIIKN